MTTFSEVVKSADGKQEDRFVFGSIILVLLVAASLLHWLYADQGGEKTIIPKGLQQHLTSLSNAADELSMMLEFGEPLPSLTALKEMGVEPFFDAGIGNMSKVLWQQMGSCYVGETQIEGVNYQIRLLITPGERPTTDWRLARSDVMSNLCKQPAQDHWHNVTSLNQNLLHRH